ncbi:hypothetical protein DU475_02365 [Rhodopseudomonas sp. WA056]|uniref:hypothetical protein n=1 Tax=Rhodopseudomonas sp. WA056 TaxID=2269367 RepID=UPI0013E03A1F|nr:hypothetical protein [Rhodopseudomonas sp. WA056]NEW86107.1 hypothetical protein [Rhodopseudomonas sp. WA056]
MLRRFAASPQSRPPLRAALALPLAALLGACAIGGSASFDSDPPQPFPANYRSEIPAFLRTYLNDPSGLREAAMAEPAQRPVDGRTRWVSCLRFTPRGGTLQDMAIVHVDGRLDRVAQQPGELCTGVVYAPFPALEKLSR